MTHFDRWYAQSRNIGSTPEVLARDQLDLLAIRHQSSRLFGIATGEPVRYLIVPAHVHYE